MKPEAQQIAIAEVCGMNVKMCPVHHSRTCCGRERDFPDFLHDLNAMHHAEMELWEDDWNGYCGTLGLVMGLSSDDSELIHATAAQRAEAFLKAIGKWQEAK